MWFPRLASDRVLRARLADGPFAVTLESGGANRVHCLNRDAERRGLRRGMPFADARALCPDLLSREADPAAERRLLLALRRWAVGYCPWVGLEGGDGLVLDVTGAARLRGGEKPMLSDMRAALARARICARVALADTRGAAWALARSGGGVAAPGRPLEAIGALPVAALRLDAPSVTLLLRLGLRRIADLEAAPRAPLARRFGPDLLNRLDQALGRRPEEISPMAEPPRYAVRMTLPEPIGLRDDVMAAASRLLEHLCAKLKERDAGARELCLTLRRVDGDDRRARLRLARPMRDPKRILPLLERAAAEVDAGFGIDLARLEATRVGPLPPEQAGAAAGAAQGRIDDLVTRLGSRIGLDGVVRCLPVDSHIPERGFATAPAAETRPRGGWAAPRPRPLRMFPPEPVGGAGAAPPARFRWRGMRLSVGRATGPERIAPEWWRDDAGWSAGVRDYWIVETREGRRLWMFRTPQRPAWHVQGEFA